MNTHEGDCSRAAWLVKQPRKLGLFWIVLFQEGPPCDCSPADCLAPEQSAARDRSGG